MGENNKNNRKFYHKMSFVAQHLKDKVVNKAGESVDLAQHLAGKTLLLYFSAHWCPPCRGFTPKLVEFYNSHHEKKEFEVIFVSADSDENSFKEYYDSMPWLAVQYDEESIKDAMNEKFEVDGIPTLVVLNPETGDVYNQDAVDG